MILDKASERVRNSLGEDTNPAELIRSAAIQVSRYLDRAGARAHSRNTKRLLMVCFQRRLQRCALRLVRRQIVTDASPYGRRVLEDDPRSKVAPISHCEHDKDKAQSRRWPKRASDLVDANRTARGSDLTRLATILTQETGNPRHACWRFMHKLGIPAQRPYKPWSEPQRRHLLQLIELHPPGEVARILNRSQASIRAMLKRLGGSAGMGKDWFTKYTLAEALHVSPEKVQQWIDRRWLKARVVVIGTVKRTVIAADDFCDFCKEHRNEIIGHRLHRERLDFVLNFVFPPAHAELLPVRTAYGPRSGKQRHHAESPDNAGGDVD